jgi:ribosomal protein S18 acetylase RimI-like enzyme
MNPVAYMQDVFTYPAHRRRGVARQLITRLAEIGREQGWPRIYWFAEADNEAAQQLYANIGVKLNFTLHALPTAPLD